MISFFARHPTAANLLMILFLAVGLMSLGKLRRETMPDFTPSEVEIRVPYPGATAEEVEEAVCQRVEDALDGVKFMMELRSDARENFGVIVAEMEEDGNIVTFKDDIDTELSAIDDFPDGVEQPIVTQLGTTDPVLSLLVSGDLATNDLKAYCEDLKDRLQQLPEVSLIEIRGFSDHQLRVELSSGALMRFGLSVAEVSERVASQSLNLPAGALETRGRDILLRFDQQRRSANELEDLVIIAQEGGAEVRLRDLGRVVNQFELDEDKIERIQWDDSAAKSAAKENHRAAILQIQKTKNQDVLRVADAVKAFVAKEAKRHPYVQLTITQDNSTLVRDRLEMLLRNGGQGVVLVFLVMWAFFNLRLSFWVVMSLPVSFLGAFYLAPFFGLTINMLTMVGLLLALGLLMDDGIVIAENIATHARRGKSGLRAAIDGTLEVRNGVFSSFLTTVFVLGPLIPLRGDIGKVLRVVPMMLILVVAISLVEAFLILPHHLAHSLEGHGEGQGGRFRRRFDDAIEWFREQVMGRAIDVLIEWRYLWAGVVVLAFLLSIGLMRGGIVRFQAFPELDGDVVQARLLMAQGTPLAQTEQTIEKITAALKRVNQQFKPTQPGEQDLVKTVYVQYNQNPDAFENGPHVATVNVDLLDAEKRDARIDDVLNAWRKEAGRPADVVTMTFSEPAFGPGGRPIDIRMQGQDFKELSLAADTVLDWLARFDGVSNLASDLRPGKQEVSIRPREGTYGLQLSSAEMARQLRGAFHGLIADEIQVGPESYEIDIRLDEAGQDSLGDLEFFHFTLPDGKLIPLGAVADVEVGRGWSRIARVDNRRTVSVRGDVDTVVTNTAGLLTKFRQELVPQLAIDFPGVEVSLEGEVKEAGKTQGSMMQALLIGLLGVFVLLSFQFRSYVEPLIVMVAIPFALIGVIWGHLLMGMDLSMPSMLGFVSLAGIVVNDSILLVLFLKAERQKGADIKQAASAASRLRFRAITLTSLTTIAGLLPLLAERSLQAQILIPLAISIAFGLMASTVLVLLVIPCLYVILGDFGWVTKVEEE